MEKVEKVVPIQIDFQQDTIEGIRKRLPPTEVKDYDLVKKLIPVAIRVYLNLLALADKDRKITIQSGRKKYKIELPSII